MDSKKEEPTVGTLNEAYKLHRVLGGGTTSKVYLGTCIKDGTLVAIKVFRSEFLS